MPIDMELLEHIAQAVHPSQSEPRVRRARVCRRGGGAAARWGGSGDREEEVEVWG